MAYTIGTESFARKKDIKLRCRSILSATADGALLDGFDKAFLMDLFRLHPSWVRKEGSGVSGITARTTFLGSRSFFLIRPDGSEEDISYNIVVDYLNRSAENMAVMDFKDAARTAVMFQTKQFRINALAGGQTLCPLTGEALSDTSHVDHVAPLTFDRLLFDFCRSRGVNPKAVIIDYVGGMLPRIRDELLLSDWEDYHQKNAVLRLVSRNGNLRQKSPEKLDWDSLCRGQAD